MDREAQEDGQLLTVDARGGPPAAPSFERGIRMKPTTRWLLSFLLIGFVATACEGEGAGEPGIAAGPRGIVGGVETDYEKWKGVICIYEDQGMYAAICTGSFLSPEIILTAGHCVYYPAEGLDAVSNPGSLQIFGGSDVLSPSERVYYPEIEEVVVHPTWSGVPNVFVGTDLALIKLAEPADVEETYGVRAEAVKKGLEGVIVGYGFFDPDDAASAGIHREGDTTVLGVVLDRVIELGKPAGICQGDSGGPFLSEEDGRWVVTGVSSFGILETCNPNGGGYSVNVRRYRGWIDARMKELVGYGLDAEGDADAGSDGDADADLDGDADADSDGDADAGSDGDADADSDGDADADSDGDGDPSDESDAGADDEGGGASGSGSCAAVAVGGVTGLFPFLFLLLE
jgi:hypothetical protein